MKASELRAKDVNGLQAEVGLQKVSDLFFEARNILGAEI